MVEEHKKKVCTIKWKNIEEKTAAISLFPQISNEILNIIKKYGINLFRNEPTRNYKK